MTFQFETLSQPSFLFNVNLHGPTLLFKSWTQTTMHFHMYILRLQAFLKKRDDDTLLSTAAGLLGRKQPFNMLLDMSLIRSLNSRGETVRQTTQGLTTQPKECDRYHVSTTNAHSVK